MFFDTHAHLNNEKFNEDLTDVIERAESGGVDKILIAAYDCESTKKALELSSGRDCFFSSAGIHPHQAVSYDKSTESMLIETVGKNRDKVVAIGEIGLDYHYDFSPRETQKEVFIKQLEIAYELDLPVIIHDRKAHDDCLAIVKECAKNCMLREKAGVFHCFSGDLNLAKKLMEYGFYISFAGPVTFKNADKVRKTLKGIPLDRLLTETDCPYLAPEPFRGKRNEPSHIKYIAQKMAEVLEIPTNEFNNRTYMNALELFSIN